MSPLQSALLRGAITDVQEAETFNAPFCRLSLTERAQVCLDELQHWAPIKGREIIAKHLGLAIRDSRPFNAPMGEVIEHFKDSGGVESRHAGYSENEGLRTNLPKGTLGLVDTDRTIAPVAPSSTLINAGVTAGVAPGPLSDFQRGYEAGLQTGYTTGYSVGELAGRAQGIRLAIKSLSDCFAKPAASALNEKIEEVKGNLLNNLARF